MLLEEVMLKLAPGGLPGGARAHRRTEVRGVTPDLRRVAPGTVFVALPDRHAADPFAAFRAADLGAEAVICGPHTPLPRGVARIEVPDIRKAFAQAASAFFGHPEHSLELLAIRRSGPDPRGGTRTSSSNLARLLSQLLPARNTPMSCLSELSCESGGRWLARPVSGLDAFEFYESLAQAVRNGERRILLEACDDLVSDLNLESRVRWLESGGCEPMVLQSGWKGSVLALGEGQTPVSTRLVGRSNWRALSAAVELAAREERSSRVFGRVPRMRGTAGYLEPLDAGQPFGVFVDAARTASEVSALVGDVRSFHRGRLVLVVGGAASASASERRELGLAAGQADEVMVTADDPENEPVESLCADVVAGMGLGRCRVEPERAQAIFRAVSVLRGGEVLVVTGKAHRNTQKADGTLIPWDDRRAIFAALADRGYGGTGL